MSKPISILLFGAGNRGADSYGPYALKHPDQVQFTAVAEPNPGRRARFAAAHHIPPERQFTCWEEALQVGKIADAVLNATQDEDHHNSTVDALDAGYDMLLEKPMATSLGETVHIVRTARKTGRTLMVCHVLRYTDFFQKVKAIFDSGCLGQIVHIAHSENVSYYHMAHSFVRGNWRNTIDSAPMILAKCCHDLDLLYWFTGEKAAWLSSAGDLRHFKPECAPPDAPARCTNGCPVSESCPFFAPRIYLENYPIKVAVTEAENPVLRTIGLLAISHPRLADALGAIIPSIRTLTRYSGWPRNTITPDPTSDEAVLHALQTGPYGRCVYHCDNSVVDHQIVSLRYPSGITATLTMHGHSHEEGRTLRVDGSRATLLGKFTYGQAWLEIHPHGLGETQRFSFPTTVDSASGHGGGDTGIMRAFVQALRGQSPPLTSAYDALESHLLGFAAEASRLGEVAVDLRSFRANTLKDA
ncbi:MAG TPA: Gfo/Idh/MocA family oxidoreductase [Brevefilum sp.]|nr:Gfo/Idh/MocA family oxidoreductase [Brevefilum sp.]HOR19668.1 Gfo/Idh/MocA family oxidoreductase [Brevefilum sp.]HPL70080.1 Gfo/Idh/MocA family oxidoreductase [Brevefilum sp.]